MIIRKFAPLAALGLIAGLAACSDEAAAIDKEQGKRLSELNLSGAAPHALALMGPDVVRIVPGPRLAIHVDGDAADRLRFTLDDGTLGIRRARHDLPQISSKPITITVTMPAPSALTISGSGSINAAGLASKAEVSIAGSGDIATPGLTSEALKVSIAGSGTYRAGGKVGTLALSIAGSGHGDMAGLTVNQADVSIMGSGEARFASDGRVTGSVMGSGTVQVKGRAQCSVSAMGSGKLVCAP